MWFTLVLAASAYETDQLTDRTHPLEDAAPIAESVLEPLLGRAVDRTNRRTRCQADDARTRHVLGKQIHKATGGKVWILSRGLFRAPGFSHLSAALYRSDADRIGFADRRDIYGDMTLWQSLILTLGGVCPSYRVAGVRLGSDKLDHFFDLGWDYWRSVERGRSEGEAVARGARTEVRMFGMLTSKTFSYADMRANWDGYRFYSGLLEPGSAFRRGADGCVQQVRPWTWDEWVDPDWDEVLNPGVHTHLVQKRLLRTLETRRDAVCSEREVWDADGTREAKMDHLNDPVPWARGRVPLRHDPYQLRRLCEPDRSEPLQPRPHRFIER